MPTYRIVTDATSDLPAHVAQQHDIYVIPMEVMVGSDIFPYTPGCKALSTSAFYDAMRTGKPVSTSQIVPITYHTHFEPFLQAGQDILYIALSSSLSSTVQSARMAAQELKEHYPERQIIVIDSLSASLGETVLACKASALRDSGMTLQETARQIEQLLPNMCHLFTVDELDTLHRSGRLSGFVAALGGTLQIKPVLHMDAEGRLVNRTKVRGRKRSLTTMLRQMQDAFLPEHGQEMLIGHGDCPEDAEQMAELVQQAFPDIGIHIYNIGPVIGAHIGPSVLALFFWGSQR